jgi:hypothetical protein
VAWFLAIYIRIQIFCDLCDSGCGSSALGDAMEKPRDDRQKDLLRPALAEKRRAGRGSLPDHLPRIEVMIEPEDTACPCCGDAMYVIGEDRSQRLDVAGHLNRASSSRFRISTRPVPS